MDLFHVTPTHNVPVIMRKGLAPQIGANSTAAGEKTPGIYLFKSWDAVEDALLNWLGDVYEDTALSILRVRVPEALLSHKEGNFEYICQITIPPENIREVMTA